MATGVYRSRCKTARAVLRKSSIYTPKAPFLGVSTTHLATHALAIVVLTVAVRIAGVVVVFAFLIIPATTSALFSSRWGTRMLIAWAVAVIASIGGLLFGYYLDFSLGPAIALFLGIVLTIAALLSKFRVLGSINMIKSGVPYCQKNKGPEQ